MPSPGSGGGGGNSGKGGTGGNASPSRAGGGGGASGGNNPTPAVHPISKTALPKGTGAGSGRVVRRGRR